MTKRLTLILTLAFLLRAAFVGSFPALYADEAAFGYNAYLLLESGRDEFGRFWPMSFESFGDWKPPMSAWLAIPFVKVFGLNELAVRLPSVILGTTTVVVVYFLMKELLGEARSMKHEARSFSDHAPRATRYELIAAFFLAISPWHILMSRMSMLVSVEVFFAALGVLGLLKGLKNPHWWIVSAIAFPGALYSYYGSRVTIPLVLLSFLLVFRRDIAPHLRSAFLSGSVGIVLLLPLFIATIRNPLILTGRARTTSIFFNDNIRLQLWDARTKAGLQHIPPVVTRFFDNKAYYYTTDIIRRYIQHFSPSFLFFQGDHQAPFRTSGFGVIHLLDLPFFLIGLFVLRSRLSHATDERSTALFLFLCLYLILAPFVASLTFLTPAANRSFNLVIPWTLVTAFGMVALIRHFTSRRSAVIAIGGMLYVISLFIFLWRYAIVTPRDNPRNWQIGKKELVQKIMPLLSSGHAIISTDHGGPAYIFFSFYLPISPDEFHRTIVRNQEFDELGFEHVDRILNITIPRNFAWEKAPIDQNAVYIGFENELPHDKIDVLSRVYYPNGGVAHEIGTLKYWVIEH